MLTRTLLITLVLLIATTLSCRADDSLQPRQPTIRALYDLSEGTLPTPTDLVRDDDAGRLDLPIDDDATDAQREFLTYLNTLDGYPLSTSVEFPLTGPINESTITGSVVVLREEGNQRVQARSHYDPDRGALVVTPREPWEPGHTYVVGIVGYERGLQGASGELVVADTPFFFLKSPSDLRDHVEAMPGDTREEREETAEDLATLQAELRPSFQLLATHGVHLDELAALTRFTTTARPAVLFDSDSGEIPMPNDLLIDPDTGLVDLPVDDDLDDEERNIRQALNTYEGFATTGYIIVRSTDDFADDTSPQALRLFHRDATGVWQEVTDLERGRFQDGSALWLRPRVALEPGERYAYVITEEARTASGHPHGAQPLGALIRGQSPLVDDDGRSTVSALTDEDALRVEPLRLRVDELLSQLEATEGLRRDRVAAAVPFRTLRSMEHARARRARLYGDGLSTEVFDVEITEPTGAAALLLYDVESVIRGELLIHDYLDPRTRAFREDGEPQERRVKFVMTLPKDVSIIDPIPVVLFGHGLMTSRELLYMIASPLARAGYAAFALDLPYHGERAVCIRDSSCEEGATCDDEGQCRFSDGSEASLLEINVSYLGPLLEGTQYAELLNYPITSGEVFIDTHDVVATRDHFAQALLDLNQAVRVLRGPELEQAVVDHTGLWVDGEDMVYLGMSLGGIMGSALSAVEPKINDFVLNVPAADLTKIMEYSVTFRPAFESAMSSRGIEESGDDEYIRFMTALRWLLDPVDPLNLVQHTIAQPFAYEEPSGETITDRQARVLIQMAEGDRVVPNVATEALSERIGVDITLYSPLITDHAFLFDPNPLAPSSRSAREDLVEFFDAR